MSSTDFPYRRKKDNVECIRRAVQVVDGTEVYTVLFFSEVSEIRNLQEFTVMEPISVKVEKCSSDNGSLEILGEIVPIQ